MESIGLAPDWDGLDFFDFDAGLEQPGIPGDEALASAEPDHGQNPWKLSEAQWQVLVNQVTDLRGLLRGFRLPSRHAMSRYFQSYIEHFHEHYPMLHLSTYSPESLPLGLALAITAVGARYRLEPKNSYSLYEAAMALALEERRLDSTDPSRQVPDTYSTVMIQALTFLMSFGAFDRKVELLEGALDLQSMTARYIRSSLRYDLPADESALQWREWARLETHRRTILISYSYLVMQSIAYDLPPVVLASEIQSLQLPCEAAVWEARNEQEWNNAVRHSGYSPMRIGDVLRFLIDDTAISENITARVSPMGSFVLLLALIQRIYLARQMHSSSNAALPPTELNVLQ